MAVRSVGTMLLLGVAVVISTHGAGAEIPAAIAAADTKPIATFHAEGAQIYECKAGSDGKLAWAFREPIATLLEAGQSVGRHYSGPTWEYKDGSAVVGKVSANAPGTTAEDIAWLKLDVVSHRGSGTLVGATIVQRINTKGGALRGPCDQAGALRSVAYSADYVFLGSGG
jgi:hypothetical protein